MIINKTDIIMSKILKAAGMLAVVMCCLLTSPGASAAVKPQWVRQGEEAMNRKRISENYKFKVFHTWDADLTFLQARKFDPLKTYVRELYGANALTMSLDSLESVGTGDIIYRVSFTDASGEDGYVYAKKVDEYCYFDDFEANNFVFEYYQLYAVSDKNILPVFDEFVIHQDDNVTATALSIVPGLGQLYKGDHLKAFGIMGTEAVFAAGAIVSHIKYNDYQTKADNGVPYPDSWHSKAVSCKVARNILIGSFASVWIYNIIDAAVVPGGSRVSVRKADGKGLALAPSSYSAGMALTYRF